MARNRRRDRFHRHDQRRRPRVSFPKDQITSCPICGETVRDVLTAIAVSAEHSPAHFDCVLNKIAEDEELKPKEKVCYLGKGSFGIVRFKNPSDLRHFTIRKRIQYEELEKPISWREDARQSIARFS